MACPKTSDFSAWINVMPPSPSNIIVAGKVETKMGNLLPKLTERVPQGINSAILILDLTIEQDGEFGTTDVVMRDARFEKLAERGQYQTVEIYSGDDKCISLDVSEAH